MDHVSIHPSALNSICVLTFNPVKQDGSPQSGFASLYRIVQMIVNASAKIISKSDV
jgi:hypothetical protein